MLRKMVEDELEPLVTKCPSCSTRFRVTENQLALAGGRVRCGVCLTVFLGADYLLLDDENAFQTGSEADAALDELLDELNEPAEASASLAAQSAAAAAVESLDGPAQLYGGFDDDVDMEPAVLELVPEDGAPGAPPPEAAEASETRAADAVAPEAPVTKADGGSISGEQRPESADEPETGGRAEASTAADQESDEPAETEGDKARAAEAPGTVRLDTEEIELIENAYDPEAATEEPEWFDEPGGPEVEAAEGAPENPSQAAAALERRIRDSGEITFKREPRRWWVGGVIAVFVLALIAQVFYFQLPTWSRNPDLRPIYQAACGLLGCELPSMRDITRMRTRNLVVRSHPEMGSALMVDAVIINQADYPQEFPDLELRFTAVGGALVAGRRFTPSEYLAGELAGARLMPEKTPIQVSLEIEDPGPEAVNYTLSFR